MAAFMPGGMSRCLEAGAARDLAARRRVQKVGAGAAGVTGRVWGRERARARVKLKHGYHRNTRQLNRVQTPSRRLPPPAVLTADEYVHEGHEVCVLQRHPLARDGADVAQPQQPPAAAGRAQARGHGLGAVGVGERGGGQGRLVQLNVIKTSAKTQDQRTERGGGEEEGQRQSVAI